MQALHAMTRRQRRDVIRLVDQYATVQSALYVEKQCLFASVVAAGDFGCGISLVVENNVHQSALFYEIIAHRATCPCPCFVAIVLYLAKFYVTDGECL